MDFHEQEKRKWEKLFFTSSLWRWFFQKIQLPFLILLLSTSLTCYFDSLVRLNIRNNFNSRNPDYAQLNWIFWKNHLHSKTNPEWHLKLLITLLACFLIGGFLLNAISHFLRNYCVSLGKVWLQKLIIYRCYQGSVSKTKEYGSEIKHSILYSIFSLTYFLVNTPLKIFENLLGIIFEVYILNCILDSKNFDLQVKKLALWFNLIIFFALMLYVIITLNSQQTIKNKIAKKSQERNESIIYTLNYFTFANQQEKEKTITRSFFLLNKDLQKLKIWLFKKTAFLLPILLVPGLNVFFYFLYYRFTKASFEGAFNVYLLSLSIQNIFRKIKNIFWQMTRFGEFYTLYNNLKIILKKIKN